MPFLLACCLRTPNAKTPRLVSTRRTGRTMAPLFTLLAGCHRMPSGTIPHASSTARRSRRSIAPLFTSCAV